MELLILIVGCVVVWYFAPTIKAFAASTEVKTQVVAEEVILDATETRARNFKTFKEKIDKDELEIVSHDDIMNLVKVRK